jgi:hypothetical protein
MSPATVPIGVLPLFGTLPVSTPSATVARRQTDPRLQQELDAGESTPSKR